MEKELLKISAVRGSSFKVRPSAVSVKDRSGWKSMAVDLLVEDDTL